jgi:mannose-6-phosphate isomerase-like protein (cupin superfamily)
MNVKVVRKGETRVFMEGPEVCREYMKTGKITMGTSYLLPGQTGGVDKGHANSHEIFSVVRGHVLLHVESTGVSYELFEEDAILMPESVPHQLTNIGTEPAVVSWSMAPSE